ncbi:MAG: sensor histidine kinase [Bacteroidia bacterium]|nr:sensor histidine kinase [Bacteroidia bacterium]
MRFLILLLLVVINIQFVFSVNSKDTLNDKLVEMKEQGNSFVISGQYSKAIKMYFDALKLAESLKDTFSIVSIYNNIGTAYKEIQDYGNAHKFLQKAEKLINRLQNKSLIADIYNTIGNIYYDTYKDSLAIKYYEKSHAVRLIAGDSMKLASSFKNLAAFYLDIGNMEKGKEMISESIKIRAALNDSSGIASSYLALGEAYLLQKQYELAKRYLNNGYSYVLLNTPIYIKRMFFEDFALLYSGTNDYKSAFKYQNLLMSLKDSVLNTEKSKQLIEMQTKYETEKKEQQLKLKSVEVEKQKYRNKVQILSFIGLAILIISIFGFVFYRNKQRQKAETMKENSRQEKLRFKAVIDSEEKERIRIAKELHDGLGQLLSSAKLNISGLEDGIQKEDEYLLKNSLNIIDEAVKEVRNISHNMMPTALMNYGLVEAISGLVSKINDSKQLTIHFNKENFNITLEKETEITFYRIVQEVINNMLKHSKAKIIEIMLSNKENLICLMISDNGVGFNISEIKNSKGIGWQNIYSRVSMLNGKINIESNLTMGTCINIEFKL